METLSLFEKPLTKAKKVENLLRSRGLGGVSNAELNHLTFRYGSVICQLRKNGHQIITGPTNSNGLVIYKWVK